MQSKLERRKLSRGRRELNLKQVRTWDSRSNELKIEFLLVPGLGPVSARKLVANGCMSLAHLRDPNLPYFGKLTSAQKIGAQFLEHIEERVARPDAEAVEVRI